MSVAQSLGQFPMLHFHARQWSLSVGQGGEFQIWQLDIPSEGSLGPKSLHFEILLPQVLLNMGRFSPLTLIRKRILGRLLLEVGQVRSIVQLSGRGESRRHTGRVNYEARWGSLVTYFSAADTLPHRNLSADGALRSYLIVLAP